MKSSNLLPVLLLVLSFSACQGPRPGTPQDVPVRTVAETAATAVDTPPQPSLPVDTVPLKALLGQIDPAKDTGFVKIAAAYTSKPDIYMRKEAYASFQKMHAAALAEGVRLDIVSATRSFGAQKTIWEKKWTGATLVGGKNLAAAVPDPAERATQILRYSSMPTTSRHHWGTDLDLNSLENSFFATGQGKKIYDWLTAHGHEYGFCQTYTAIGADRPHGYQEEKWHWSYLPISTRFLRAYQAQVTYAHIAGFKGAEVAKELNVIEHYVGGIAPRCKE